MSEVELSVTNLLITTRRVGALPLVAAAAVVRRRRAVSVAAVVVVALAVPAAPAAVVVVVSVAATSVVSVVTAPAYSRFPHVDTGRGRVCALRDGVVDADAAPVDLHAGALVLSDLRVFLVLEVHEAESSRTTRLSINNDLYFVHWSIFGEDVVDLLFRSI